ncbi:hypothetical protein H2248_011309 [Termitomyces sp. 'cryptogamus']|nr:hypothetical protein H2248_011309 [Termitomyces sp. 'cryptogamus']
MRSDAEVAMREKGLGHKTRGTKDCDTPAWVDGVAQEDGRPGSDGVRPERISDEQQEV